MAGQLVGAHSAFVLSGVRMIKLLPLLAVAALAAGLFCVSNIYTIFYLELDMMYVILI